jgi:hypothetical protein
MNIYLLVLFYKDVAPMALPAGTQSQACGPTGLKHSRQTLTRFGLRGKVPSMATKTMNQWRKIAASLPQDPITPKIEARIVRMIRAQRQGRRRKLVRAATGN